MTRRFLRLVAFPVAAAGIALVPRSAAARGEIAVVSYEDGAATGGEAFAAGEAAIAIARDRADGRTVVRLDGVSDRAKACEDARCLADIAVPSGAEFLLSVSVSRPRANKAITARFVLVLVKSPVEQSIEVARAERDVGTAPEDWRAAMEPSLGPLLDPIEPLPAATGTLLITANVSDADVRVDGGYVGRTPLPTLPTVPVGRRSVSITRERFVDFTTDVEVLEGQESRVDATLERVPDPDDKPFYARPVTWVIAGGVVVVGVVVTALVLSGGEDAGHPNAVVVPALR